MAVAPSHFDDAPHVAELLYRQHAAALRVFCRQRVGPDDADEVVQTTFLRALRALNRGERPYAERAWLFTIARNVCATRATSAARRHELLDPSALEIQAPAPVDHTVDADLAAALASLPEGQRRAFVLRAVHELSYDEIATELGVSHAAVESWIFRARRRLAFTVGTSRRRLAFDVSSLAGALKSLVPGWAAKVAVAAAVMGTAVVVGPTVVGGDASDPARPLRAEPVQNAGPATAERSRTKPERRSGVRASIPTNATNTGAAGPVTSEPAELAQPQPAADDPSIAPVLATGVVPVDAPALPAVELPLPPLDLPRVELPRLEPPSLPVSPPSLETPSPTPPTLP